MLIGSDDGPLWWPTCKCWEGAYGSPEEAEYHWRLFTGLYGYILAERDDRAADDDDA
jgi:hypothetical protein